uniref:Uncharacterized protein n=1 Tax=Aegilops tauschii subsp. strangulata TaxID=200361 RepID=A0A453L8R4_AEGTS
MYVPQSSRGGGGSAGEQPRVYQVWRGSNVSAPSSLSLSLDSVPCAADLDLVVLVRAMIACLPRGLRAFFGRRFRSAGWGIRCSAGAVRCPLFT